MGLGGMGGAKGHSVIIRIRALGLEIYWYCFEPEWPQNLEHRKNKRCASGQPR